MNLQRRRPSRVLWLALGLSVMAHAVFVAFMPVHATAHVVPSQKPAIVELLARPTPRPTPRPKPVHERRVPRPIVADPVVRPLRPHVVAAATHRVHDLSTSGASHAVTQTGAAFSGSDLGDAPPAIGPAATGDPVSTSAPVGEATPLTTPAPIASACPSEPHDATVTQAVTPELPQSAAEQGAVGRVVVAVQLARDGSVVHASVHASSGYASLDRAAVDAAAQARYAPASDGCTTIAGTYLYVVDFSE